MRVSSSAHPSREALEAYVLDTLEPGPARALEQHVRCCDRCAEALAAEARREVALADLVPCIARQPQRTPAATAPANPWLSPFLLAATSALALVITAGNPRGGVLRADAPVLMAQAVCQGPVASEVPLLCLGDSGGEAALCSRPMSIDLGPRRSELLFSCSGCSCPAEPPR